MQHAPNYPASCIRRDAELDVAAERDEYDFCSFPLPWHITRSHTLILSLCNRLISILRRAIDLQRERVPFSCTLKHMHSLMATIGHVALAHDHGGFIFIDHRRQIDARRISTAITACDAAVTEEAVDVAPAGPHTTWR